ncbi:hypothetical protein [Carboxylicivirga marina]|uniref:hypothetical protein n=1 Tax=Carboxylicivirga marina TaxID=2800988 RepID=UPI0025960322|nr:hypothetical protein [uncultured Carboxylicivirga sp.]
MQKIYLILITCLIIACDKDDSHFLLDITKTSSFSGTLHTVNSDNTSGTVAFTIENGSYRAWTNLPYGRGAGTLEVNHKTISFIDTLFLIVPANYGPSYVPSGDYRYRFDGYNLNLWSEKDNGSVRYNLVMSDCDEAHAGVLRDLTNFDGCGWVIELSNGLTLEPVNLNDFDIELEDNRSVCVQFHERTDLGSYCMQGTVVEIDFI